MVTKVIYPFAPENEALVRRLVEGDTEAESYILVSPKTWNVVVDMKPASLTNDYNTAIAEADELIIVDSPKALYLYKDIVKKCAQALDEGKKVYCGVRLKGADLQMLTGRSTEEGRFMYLPETHKNYDLSPDEYRLLARQNCIIVSVAGMIRGMELSTACIRLAEEYEERGYKVAIVSGYANCELLPNHYFIPDCIFQDGKAECDKVLMFNKFIAHVEEKSKAEILIVCLTDGIMSYSDIHYGDFGITAIEQASALNTDHFVLGVIPELLAYDPKTALQELKMMCRYRLGMELKSVLIENREVDEYELDMKEHYTFVKSAPDAACSLLSEIRSIKDDVKYYDGSNPAAYGSIVDDSIEDLSEEADIL